MLMYARIADNGVDFQKHCRAMFLSKHRLNIASLRIGIHRIVKNIASLRKVKIAHPWPTGKGSQKTHIGTFYLVHQVNEPD